MINISTVKIGKPEDVVVKDKFVRYKIANFRKFYPKEKSRASQGKAIFVYDYGDSLNILQLSYSFQKRQTGEKPLFLNRVRGNLKIKIKNGRVNIWRFVEKDGARGIRNSSNNPPIFDSHIFNFKQVKPVYKKRFNKILVNFLKRNNIKFKYSKDCVKNLLYACYPGVKGFDLNSLSLNSLYSRHFRHGDIKYVIKKCFGHDSKQLTKMVCERVIKDKNFDVLYLGLALKKLIPLDYYYKLIDIDLKEIKHIHNFVNKLRDSRRLLKCYKPQRLLKLFLADDFNTFNFSDSFRLFPDHMKGDGWSLPEKPKNWREIHDRIAPPRPVHNNGIAFRSVPDEDIELPIRDAYKKINGLEFGDFKIEVPNHSKKLVEYSDIMNNCIRGYSRQVTSGGCNLLGIYKNNELTYNISIYNKQISQFLGKYNSQPNENDKKIILDALMEKNIVNKETGGQVILDRRAVADIELI
jgi:PcfJ-like protein